MNRPSIPAAAAWGAFTSLGVIALTYMGKDVARLPYIPDDIFQWLARLIHGLSNWPAYAGQFSAAVLFVAAGACLGAILAWIASTIPQPEWILLGMIGGWILFIFVLLLESGAGFGGAAPIGSTFWFGLIFTGWGAILGRLIRDWCGRSPEPNLETSHPRMSRRQFLYVVIAGVLTLALSALRISYHRNQERTIPGGSSSKPLPPGYVDDFKNKG